MKKALITDNVHPIMRQRFEENGYEVLYKPNIQQAAVESMISDVEVLIVNSKINVDKAFIDQAKNLKYIGRLGSGMEIIDAQYAKQRGINVYNSPKGNKDAVAEHAIGMLLALFNQLVHAHHDVVAMDWNREKRRGEELMGKTIGLIGYGNTGKAMAKKLSCFDVNVLFYDKYLNEASDRFGTQVDLKTLQNEIDVLSFHVPYNKETHYYFNRHFISLFNKPFYLINTSRGKIVETEQLIKGLKNKKILGACIDVFENEKPISYTQHEKNMYKELFSLANVVLSPHVAGWTHQSKYKLAEILVKKIIGNA